MRCRVNRSQQSGITLIETMIAILVLSFGMLGMLSVFLNSLKITSSSHYRSIAAQQMYALSDNIRSSLPQLTVYPSASGGAVSNCLATAGCTAAEITQTEIALWQTRLAALLPSGRGVICQDATPGDGDSTNWQCSGGGQFVIKVCWDDSRIPTSSAIECVRTTL